MRSKACWFGLLLICALLSALPAAGQPGEDETAWRTQDAAARAAMDKGDYKSALDGWAKALAAAERVNDAGKIMHSHARLALASKKLNLWDDAAAHYQKAIDLLTADGRHPLELATVQDNFGNMYDELKRSAEAERLHRSALDLYRKSLGPDDADVLLCEGNLAMTLEAQGKYTEAETMMQQVIAAQEKQKDQVSLAITLDNLATMYVHQKKFTEAEAPRKRALELLAKALGPDHPEVGICLLNMGVLYLAEGKPAEAEPYFHRALEVQTKVFGESHPALLKYLQADAEALRGINRPEEAEKLEARAQAIAAQLKN